MIPSGFTRTPSTVFSVWPRLLLSALALAAVLLLPVWLQVVPNSAIGAELMPGGAQPGEATQESCDRDDDVSVNVEGLADLDNNYLLEDPPDYANGDRIAIYYTVANNSCRDVTVTVELRGSVSKAKVHNADTGTGPCTEGCDIAAGAPETNIALWDLGKHPNANGEKVVATVVVKSPDSFSDVNPDNDTDTSAEAINIVNEEPAPDITVKSVTPPNDEIVIGDTVEFSVTLGNEGDAAADATVILDRGENTAQLDSETVSSIDAGGEKTAKLSWDTTGSAAGEHELRVLAQAEGDANPNNDSKTVTLTLREPLVDVAVTSVTPSADAAVVGHTVNFTVKLRNNGDVAVAPTVSLHLGDDTEPLDTDPVETMASGAEATVTIPWDTTGAAAGTHNLRVVADADDDDDTSNNSTTVSLTLHNPVDVALSMANPPGSPVVRGNSVDVEFTVQNSGNHDAGEVTLKLYVNEATAPADVKTLPSLAAGVPISKTFQWATTDAELGHYRLRITASTPGDTDTGNNAITANIELRNWLAIKQVSPTSADAIVGDTVQFAVDVENVGSAALSDVLVGLYKSDGSPDAVATETIDVIPSGNTTPVTLAWDTAGHDVGEYDLTVAAGADGQGSDDDDYMNTKVNLQNPIAVAQAVAVGDDHVAGNPVSVSVGVRNASVNTIRGVAVQLYVNDAADAVDPVVIDSINMGETETVSLVWNTVPSDAGDHTLRAVASLADFPTESDDETTVEVSLREPLVSVALTDAVLDRKIAVVGDTLRVTATVTNNGEAPISVPVALFVVETNSDPDLVSRVVSDPAAPGATADVVIKWDTSDYGVGAQRLRVAAEAPGGTTNGDDERLLDVELFQSAFADEDAPADCIEDVRVKVAGIRDPGGALRATPDYRVGEELWVAYQIYNYSCAEDVVITLSLAGSQSAAPITDGARPCLAKCLIPPGGQVGGEVLWLLPSLPSLERETVTAEIKVIAPDNFADADASNNRHDSDQWINVVHPDDIRIDIGDADGNKGKIGGGLMAPVFSTANVRLVSAEIAQAAIPFAKAVFPITVEVANDGAEPAPAVIRVILTSPGRTELYSSEPTMLPAGQTVSTLDVPTRHLVPGKQTIEVVLSAVNDVTPGDNSASLEIYRTAPSIALEITDVAITPDVLMVGDKATITASVRNQSEVPLAPVLALYVDDNPTPATSMSMAELGAGDPGEGRLSWNIPSASGMLGRHTLTLALSTEDEGVAASVSREVRLYVNAEITSISAGPSEMAMQGEEVEVLIAVRNNGPATANVPVTLTFPEGRRQPEVRSPPAKADETVSARFTWKTGNYRVGIHILTATIPTEYNLSQGDTSAELPFRLTPAVITASIVDISVSPPAPVVGEPVTVTVTVGNDGPIAANIPVTLHYPSRDKQPETRRPRVAPRDTGTATFTWRTGNYDRGVHRFRVEIAGTSPSAETLNIRLLPPVIDVEILGVGSEPAETPMRGERVEIWVEVRNNGLVAVNVPVQLAFPSADKRPERKSRRVGPGETARVKFTWKTLNYDLGVHTLTAALLTEGNTTRGDTRATIQLQLIAVPVIASIAGVSAVPRAPVVGEPVDIAVTVHNDGPMAVNIPVTLHFPSGDKQPETFRPRVAPGETGTAKFTWHTGDYDPGAHNFRIKIAASPPLEETFAVELLPPVVDVAIVGIGSDPAETAMRGEAVEIWVDVRNNGPVAINVPVQLTFPSDDKLPERKSASIDPGKTARVKFEWKTANYDLDVHTLTAGLLAADNTTAGETEASIQIRLIEAPIIASFLNVATYPEAPVVGQPVTITVTVRNDGPLATGIPVTLHFPSADKQPETLTPSVEPGATKTATFTWSTGNYDPGTHRFTLELGTAPPSVRRFTVELLPPPFDAEIVGIGSDPAHTAMRGEAVEIWVDVRNNGPVATNVLMQLAFPSDDKLPEQKSPRIGPGETARVYFIWKTRNYDAGLHILTATLLAENNATTGDTSASVQLRLITPRVIASFVGVVTSPKAPVAGEPVTITVTVRNNGSISGSIPITLYYPSAQKQPETRRPRVAPGNKGTAKFTWRTGNYDPGTHNFRIKIAASPPLEERFAIELLPPAADFTVDAVQAPNPLHPIVKGDWVEVAASVRNLGPYAGRATVNLYDATKHGTMYATPVSLEPGEARRVKFTWKTLRYSAGEYAIQVRLNAQYDFNGDNDRSDSVNAVILTDRDITVGFGSDAPADKIHNEADRPALRSSSQLLEEIVFLDGDGSSATGLAVATSHERPGAGASRNSDDPATVSMYWLGLSAQASAHQCSRYQERTGNSQPRAVLCPKVSGLVR